MNTRNFHLTRVIILFVTLLMVFVPTLQASAALVKCRTDPIFYLSNGQVVTVVLEINTDRESIIYANYVVHVPAGVTVNQVIYLDEIGYLETYQVKQDSPANTYTTESFVLAKSEVKVVATTSLATGEQKTASGYSNQRPIIATIVEKTSAIIASASSKTVKVSNK